MSEPAKMTKRQARTIYDLALAAMTDDPDAPLREDVEALNALARAFDLRVRQIGTEGLPTLRKR